MIELIPAIDLIDGKCVRLTKGDYATQKTYNEDPVAVAREFESYASNVCTSWTSTGHDPNISSAIKYWNAWLRPPA